MLVIQLSFFISSSEISSLATGPIVFSNNKASGNSVLSSTTFGYGLFLGVKSVFKNKLIFFIFLNLN